MPGLGDPIKQRHTGKLSKSVDVLIRKGENQEFKLHKGTEEANLVIGTRIGHKEIYTEYTLDC